MGTPCFQELVPIKDLWIPIYTKIVTSSDDTSNDLFIRNEFQEVMHLNCEPTCVSEL